MWNHFSSWIHNWLRRLITCIAVTGAMGIVYLAMVVLTTGAGYAPINHLQAVAQNLDAAATESVSTNGSVWNREVQPDSKAALITVYRSPYCGCCGGWLEHLKTHGFQTTDIKTSDMEALKQKYNLPEEMASCHTAIIDGYVIEGHVPANDIKRLLKEKPNIAGLSVPQMPVGTPGMDMGDKKEPFAVLAFHDNGKVEVFKEYRSY
jgi:hypothetical protein